MLGSTINIFLQLYWKILRCCLTLFPLRTLLADFIDQNVQNGDHYLWKNEEQNLSYVEINDDVSEPDYRNHVEEGEMEEVQNVARAYDVLVPKIVEFFVHVLVCYP